VAGTSAVTIGNFFSAKSTPRTFTNAAICKVAASTPKWKTS